MSKKTYQLYCEICNFKKITDGSDVCDFEELKTSPVPSGIPYVDFETKKLISPKSKSQIRKFKCPKCGRLVIPKIISDPQQELNDKLETEERLKKRHEDENLISEIEERSKKQHDKIKKNWTNGSKASFT